MPSFIIKPLNGHTVKFGERCKPIALGRIEHAEHVYSIAVYWRSWQHFGDYLFQVKHQTGGAVIEAFANSEGSVDRAALIRDIAAAVLAAEGDPEVKLVLDGLREDVGRQIASHDPWPPEIGEALQRVRGDPSS